MSLSLSLIKFQETCLLDSRAVISSLYRERRAKAAGKSLSLASVIKHAGSSARRLGDGGGSILPRARPEISRTRGGFYWLIGMIFYRRGQGVYRTIMRFLCYPEKFIFFLNVEGPSLKVTGNENLILSFGGEGNEIFSMQKRSLNSRD